MLALIERRIDDMPSLLKTLRTRATRALLHEVRVQLDAAADAGALAAAILRADSFYLNQSPRRKKAEFFKTVTD